MILIIGSEGAQGKRYQAILNHLEIDFGIVDAKFGISLEMHLKNSNAYDGFLVATPTHTHAEIIRKLLPYGKKILCEKPVCTDIEDLENLLVEIDKSGCPFRMIMQYRFLVDKRNNNNEVSYYSYFRHGNDGLIWDCFQIIALAKNTVFLSERSPVWQCSINGEMLEIQDMDHAYVEEIKDWLGISNLKDATCVESPFLNEILRMHKKVSRYADEID